MAGIKTGAKNPGRALDMAMPVNTGKLGQVRCEMSICSNAFISNEKKCSSIGYMAYNSAKVIVIDRFFDNNSGRNMVVIKSASNTPFFEYELNNMSPLIENTSFHGRCIMYVSRVSQSNPIQIIVASMVPTDVAAEFGAEADAFAMSSATSWISSE